MDVVGLATKLSSNIFGSKSDDDFSDRLNYRYTVALLILFSIILTTRQYGSEVIKCWVPAHFTSNYEQYVSQICWIQNTYYFHPNQSIPKSEIERNMNEIKYYQWVSFVLLIQALIFYMPRIFWRTFSVKAGLNICDLVDAAHNYKSAEHFEKQRNYMDYLVKNIDQFVDDNRRYEDKRTQNRLVKCLETSFPCFGRFLGNYIVILYIIVKYFYILNTVVQIFFISGLLGNNFWLFGVNFIYSLIKGEGWTISNSKYFPKVTLCDFMIREVGNPSKSHKYTVQCVLPINLFNQQIFTAIWFWYVLVLLCNVIGIFVWIQRSIPLKSNKWITQRVGLFNSNIKLKDKNKKKSNRLEHFLNRYLEPDGKFMIRMIANNTSDYVATDLIHHLWCQHDEKYGTKFLNEPHQSDVKCVFKHKKHDQDHETEHHNNHNNNSSDSTRFYGNGGIGGNGNGNGGIGGNGNGGNYATFPQVYDPNLMNHFNINNSNQFQRNNKIGEYVGLDGNDGNDENLTLEIHQQNRLQDIEQLNDKVYPLQIDETRNFIRKRDNPILPSNGGFNVNSTKV